MPRFLLTIIDGDGPASTPIEMDLPDFAAVRREAVRTACLSLNQNPDRFWNSGEWQMIVTDASGLMLFTMQMNATVAPVAMAHFPMKETSR